MAYNVGYGGWAANNNVQCQYNGNNNNATPCSDPRRPAPPQPRLGTYLNEEVRPESSMSNWHFRAHVGVPQNNPQNSGFVMGYQAQGQGYPTAYNAFTSDGVQPPNTNHSQYAHIIGSTAPPIVNGSGGFEGFVASNAPPAYAGTAGPGAYANGYGNEYASQPSYQAYAGTTSSLGPHGGKANASSANADPNAYGATINAYGPSNVQGMSYGINANMYHSGNQYCANNGYNTNGSAAAWNGAPPTAGTRTMAASTGNAGTAGRSNYGTNFGFGYTGALPPNLALIPSDAQPARTMTSGNQSSGSVGSGANDSSSLASFIRSGAANNDDDEDAMDISNDWGSGRHTPSPGSARPHQQYGRRPVRPEWISARPNGSHASSTLAPMGRIINPPKIESPSWAALEGYKPTLDQALQCFPFSDPTEVLKPHRHGVLKITNIPYNTSKNELITVIPGRVEIVKQPASSPYYAVHLIVDRPTGKTMDGYIEVATKAEAASVVESYNRRVESGRITRIGNREVQIHKSSQTELMCAMFPKAKNVIWTEHEPHVFEDNVEYYPEVTAAGFDGFVTGEEMVMQSKFVECPARSPFAQRCPHRLYESMISTLHKYPWHASRDALLSDRKKLFAATLTSTRVLSTNLRRASTSNANIHPNLTEALLQELAIAALGCPGFSEQQKANVVSVMQAQAYGHIADNAGMSISTGSTARTASYWPFLVLIKTPGVEDSLLDVYIEIILSAIENTARMSDVGAESTFISSRTSTSSSTLTSGSGGRTQRFSRLCIDYGTHDMGQLSLAEIAQKETDTLFAILQEELDAPLMTTRRAERGMVLE